MFYVGHSKAGILQSEVTGWKQQGGTQPEPLRGMENAGKPENFP